MGNIGEILYDLLYVVPAILIAMSFHECAHGYVSYRLGDPTPKVDGRLSLNPFKHLDIIGTLMLIVFRFGWAKPVMVNPMYYKKPKRDIALVAIAGPLVNFILAFISFLILAIIYRISGGTVSNWLYATYQFFLIFASINVGLGVFNLIPLPPLDGSKVIGFFIPDSLYYKYMSIEQIGMILLLVLIFTNVLSKPLGFLIQFSMDFLHSFATSLVNLF